MTNDLHVGAGILLPLMAIVLVLIGFLRSAISGQKPAFLISPETYSSEWLKENSWRSLVAVFFIGGIFLYNLFAWLVYGIISIADFIAFLFKRIWWGLKWIWYDLLHPTVFALVKLAWHYLVVMSWKFFSFAIRLIPTAYTAKHVRFAFFKLLIFAIVAVVVVLLSFIFSSPIVLGAGIIVIFFFLQYSIFTTVAHLKSEHYTSFQVMENMKTIGSWFLVSVISAVVLLLLKSLSDTIIVNGLSVSLSQLFLPATLLFAIGITLATLYLPAYSSETGTTDFKLLSFLKAVLWRLPKLILAQTYQYMGWVVVAIIPLLVGWMLNLGIGEVTGKDVVAWSYEIVQVGEHLPAIKNNSAQLERNNKTIEQLTDSMESSRTRLDNQLEAVRAEVSVAQKLKDNIIDNQIHSFEGEAYIGEYQPFSIPSIAGSTAYDWALVNTGTKQQLVKTTLTAPDYNNSSIFSYKWTNAGNYRITITPRNTCGTGETLERLVTVVAMPNQNPSIKKPSGPSSVCFNQIAEYKAPTGFSSYEWTIPQDAKITRRGSNNTTISIQWGAYSGPVRVKATNAKGVSTNWAGMYVNVTGKPGQVINQEADVPDEVVAQVTVSHPPFYISREAAQDAIDKILDRQNTIEERKQAIIREFENKIAALQGDNVSLAASSSTHVTQLISAILVALGLALLVAIVFATSWLYIINFQYELFGAEQSGPHYWQRLLTDLQSRNPHQPLLGLFALLTVAGVGGLIFYLLVLGRIVNFTSLL